MVQIRVAATLSAIQATANLWFACFAVFPRRNCLLPPLPERIVGDLRGSSIAESSAAIFSVRTFPNSEIPGLFWVFVILSAACLGVTGWMHFG